MGRRKADAGAAWHGIGKRANPQMHHRRSMWRRAWRQHDAESRQVRIPDRKLALWARQQLACSDGSTGRVGGREKERQGVGTLLPSNRGCSLPHSMERGVRIQYPLDVGVVFGEDGPLFGPPQATSPTQRKAQRITASSQRDTSRLRDCRICQSFPMMSQFQVGPTFPVKETTTMGYATLRNHACAKPS